MHRFLLGFKRRHRRSAAIFLGDVETKPDEPVPTRFLYPKSPRMENPLLRSVRSIETSLSTDRVTATVEKRLPPLTSEIELRAAEMAKLLAASVPLEFLHSMEIVLQTYRDQLSSWNHDLTERVKNLDGQIAQLDRLSKIWKSTLQLPELSKTAPEIPKRVQDLIDSIGHTQQAAESLRERDLTLQGRVLEATTRLQIASSAFEQAQADAVKNLFVQDSPPLWSLWVEHWREESRASLIAASKCKPLHCLYQTPADGFLASCDHYSLPLSRHFLVRRGVHKWTEEEPSLRRAAPVFDSPVSTAITLSFLITGPIYSMAPFLLRAILGGALLIPTALILRRLIDRTLFPILNALLVFYFVDQLRLITAPLPPWGRSVLGAEMLGGTLFLIWLIWSKHSPTVGANTTKLFARAIRACHTNRPDRLSVDSPGQRFWLRQLRESPRKWCTQKRLRCGGSLRCHADRRRANHHIAEGASSWFNARRSPQPAHASAAYLWRC